jgi:hypothetical protein
MLAASGDAATSPEAAHLKAVAEQLAADGSFERAIEATLDEKERDAGMLSGP